MQQTHLINKIAGKGQHSGIVEGVVGLALLVAINFFWFRNNMGFLGVNPHPYWIIVLLLAARYGFMTGLGVGVLCAVTLLGMLKLNRPYLAFTDLLEIKNVGQPLLFVAAGLVFGEIRELQKTKFKTLQVTHDDLQEKFNSLKQRFDALDKAKQELDTRIISQEHTLSTLYEAAQALKSLKEDEIYPATLDLLKNFIAAEAGSVYLLSGNKLVLTAALGERQQGERTRETAPDEGMMGRAIASGETVSLDTMIFAEDFTRHAESGTIITVPLLTSKEEAVGVLNIEKIPFLKFNQQTINMTSLIGDWCSAAIENARTYKDSKDRDIVDESTGAYTNVYYHKRLDEEFKRSYRYKIPLSLVIYEIVDFRKFSVKIQQEIKTIVSVAIKSKLRTIDLIFSDANVARYNVVLPNTPLVGARVAIEKIFQEIQAYKFRPYDDDRPLQIRLGAAELDENMKQYQDFINLAESEMRVL